MTEPTVAEQAAIDAQAAQDAADATAAAEAKATEDAAATKAADEKATQEAADKKAADDKAAKEKADGKFTELTVDDITLPEGFEADEVTQASFLALANKHQFSKEQVGELVDLQATAMKAASEGASKLWSDMQATWTAEAKADSDIGGDKLEGVLTTVSQALDQYGSKEARDAFDLTGAGNNPHVIKFVHKMAAALAEGGPVSGAPASGEKTAAQIMYPDQGA